MSNAMTIPHELIQLIYMSLALHDFEVARLSCVNWYQASRDIRLLRRMLSRGGWNVNPYTSISESSKASHPPSELQYLSSFVAREAGFSPLWRGHARLAPQHTTDLTDISNGFLGFQASVCSQYLIAIDGCLVRIYALGGPAGLQSRLVLVCPRRVLAVSMDASEQAILAVLLDDRMAMSYDLESTLGGDTSSASMAPAFVAVPHVSGVQQIDSVPTISGRVNVYHSLCSPEDPPRSVAVSSTRQSIAFGSASGIALHWVDFGRNVTKWFPLTAPTDSVYFLPRRPGVDSPNKLRLIGSKNSRGQSTAISKATSCAYRRQLRDDSFPCGRPPFDRMQRGPYSGADFDHHGAIPLSDGQHIIFTDPPTGRLCLGSEAHVTGGPVKLLRKIIFCPPAGSDVARDRPATLYTAGQDLSVMVRLVAVFNDTLVLYTVPSEVLQYLRRIDGASLPDLIPEMTDGDHWSHWPEQSPMLPLEIHGLVLGKIPDIVEVALSASIEPVLHVASADNCVTTWRFERPAAPIRSKSADRAAQIAADDNIVWVV